jgi:membrane-associated phospholipid phosphatase
MVPNGTTFYYIWEVQLIKWLQTHLPGTGLSFLSFWTLFGEAMVMVLIIGFAYWSWDKKLGRAIGLNAITGLAWNTLSKNVVLRRRPYFDNKEIKILRPVARDADIYDIAAQGYSFPSGHSTVVAAVFGTLAYKLKKGWAAVAAIVIILLTGISRFAVGAHYPTDVFIGWMCGLLSVVIVGELDKRLSNSLILYGILLITIIPGFFYCKTTDFYDTAGLLIGFMGGLLLDEHYVHFENTRKPLYIVLRMVGGIAIFLILNKVLKMPFSKEFLDSRTFAAMMVRFMRYGIISFVEYGLYPMLFKYEKRFEKK